MHIQFEKIRYKNILAVGNQLIEIDFRDSKTTLISGTNGVGKSTMIEAIMFGLFNKSFRKINKPQLVNSINKKELEVEIFFSIGSIQYIVKRGMKPSVFEIWKNGEQLNKDAASRDYQEYLEQNILKMTHKSFTQIVILGAKYVSFMELPAGQRREIIEDLLDIQVFSTMNVLLKDRLTDIKQSINEENHQIELLKTKLESAEHHNLELQKLKTTEIEKMKEKISEHLESIDSNKLQVERLEQNITELVQTITDKNKKRKLLEEVKNLLYDLDSKKRSSEKDIRFYSENDNCPTCKQGLEHEFKKTSIEEKLGVVEKLSDAHENLLQKKKEIETRLEEISDVEDQINLLHKKANDFRLTNKLIMNQLKSIKEDLSATEKEVDLIDETVIKDLRSELKEHQKSQSDLFEKRETLGVVSTMLKDGGIKTSIIRTYIPIMNQIINQYLSEFELFVNFNLKEDFTEEIKSRFRDTFSFESFSEGEKLRISLSILFAWRALAKLRNSVSTNILFMDEILDSSADSAGVESLIEILKKLNPKDNVFIISHRSEQFSEKFDRQLRFEKIKNFTQISNSEL